MYGNGLLVLEIHGEQHMIFQIIGNQ